jgi:LysR family transcriptional regulator, pca operon transcriptional activator
MTTAIKLRHLRIFQAIVAAGSLALVAKAQKISQPALSRSLAELETILGKPLFLRKGRKMILTDAGRAFDQYSALSLSSLDQGMAVVQSGIIAVLRIGLLPNFAQGFVRDSVLKFLDDHPHHQISLCEGTQAFLQNELSTRSLDLIISGGASLPSAGADAKLLYDEEIIAVADPSGKLVNLPYAQALSEARLILPRASDFGRAEVDNHLCQMKHSGSGVILETSVVAVALNVVQSAEVLWFVCRSAVAPYLAQGRLVQVRFQEPIVTAPVYIIRQKIQAPEDATQDAIESFCQMLLPMAQRTAPLKLV